MADKFLTMQGGNNNMHLFHRLRINTAALSSILALSLLLFFSGAGADDKSALELFGPLRKDMALGSPGYSSPRFSPDGKLLAFDACNKSKCENVIYDIANDRYFAYRDKQSRRITNVSFSPSGKKLTFVVKGQKGFLWWKEPQDRIAVGSVQENIFTFVTPPEGAKRYPEFWGEDAVLFVGEELFVVETQTGSRRGSFRRLFMAELDGKTVRVLFKDFHKYKDVRTSLPRTRPLDFYGPSRPRPLWDGKHIVLSEFGYSKYLLSVSERRDIKADNEVLRISIPDETVTPMPIAITAPHQPASAIVVKRLYVVGRLDRESAAAGYYVHDVFAVNENKAERVSQLAVYIYGMDVNPNGTLLALVVPTPDRSFINGRLLLYDTRNHSYRELKPKAVSELLIHIGGQGSAMAGQTLENHSHSKL